MVGYARELYTREKLGRQNLLEHLLNQAIHTAFSELSSRAIVSGFQQSAANCFAHINNVFYTETGDIIRTKQPEHQIIAKTIDRWKSVPSLLRGFFGAASAGSTERCIRGHNVLPN